jgi:hypothetical protein
MRKIQSFIASALVALAAGVQAAPDQDVNLDGSAKTPKKATLAASANHQLRQADVPSAKSEPVDVKAQADAEMASRAARAKGPRLHVQRQNLKGGDAAHAIAQQTTPNTIDHDTAYGDKDHTQQVTDLKVTIKK